MNEDVNEVNHQSLSIEKKKLVNLVNIHTYTCLIENEDSFWSAIEEKVTCKTKLSMEKQEQSYNQL